MSQTAFDAPFATRYADAGPAPALTRPVGVLGAAPPDAVAALARCVAAAGRARGLAVPLITYQAPLPPDAETRRIGVPALRRMARGLEAAVVQALALPSVEGHLDLAELGGATDLPVVDMLRATALRLATTRRVGVIATRATRRSGVIEATLLGEVVYAPDAVVEALLAKAQRRDLDAAGALARAAQDLAARSGPVLIAAVALSDTQVTAPPGVTVIHALECLAEAIVAQAEPVATAATG